MAEYTLNLSNKRKLLSNKELSKMGTDNSIDIAYLNKLLSKIIKKYQEYQLKLDSCYDDDTDRLIRKDEYKRVKRQQWNKAFSTYSIDSELKAEFMSIRMNKLTVLVKYNSSLYTMDVSIDDGEYMYSPSSKIEALRLFTGDYAWPVSSNIRNVEITALPGVVMLIFVKCFTNWYSEYTEGQIEHPYLSTLSYSDVVKIYQEIYNEDFYDGSHRMGRNKASRMFAEFFKLEWDEYDEDIWW